MFDAGGGLGRAGREVARNGQAEWTHNSQQIDRFGKVQRARGACTVSDCDSIRGSTWKVQSAPECPKQPGIDDSKALSESPRYRASFTGIPTYSCCRTHKMSIGTCTWRVTSDQLQGLPRPLQNPVVSSSTCGSPRAKLS